MNSGVLLNEDLAIVTGLYFNCECLELKFSLFVYVIYILCVYIYKNLLE